MNTGMRNLDTLQPTMQTMIRGRMTVTKRRPDATNGNTASEAVILTSASAMNLVPQISFYDFRSSLESCSERASILCTKART